MSLISGPPCSGGAADFGSEEGYGAGYGELLRPQFQGAAYTLPFQVRVTADQRAAGLLPNQWQFRLFRELASGAVESVRWLEATPDSGSGLGEFRYLPTSRSDGEPQRYWIDWVGPDGEAPGRHGPYVPIIE